MLENVIGVDKEPIREPEEEEEISLKVMEVEAKQNDVNESFKTFFNKVGLKFALKRGSRDETVAKEEKEEEEEEEAAVLENTRTKAGVLEEEWTHLDTLAEDDVTMSPIKKFFSTGIFAGRLQKKRVSLEDETMTREIFLQTQGETADPLNSDIPLGDEEDNPTLVDPETPKEMEYVPSSPLKKLLQGSRLAMLKRQKDEKEIEEAKAVGMSDQLDVAENDTKQSPEEEGSPWTSFKKLLSPKKRVNKPGSTSDEAQNSKDEEDHILERKDSWDAIVPGQSHSVSESDPITIPAGVDDAEAVGNDDHAGEGDAGPAGDEAGSAWDTFKRLMSPKRKARIPERGRLSPEPEDGRENSFSAKFFPGWKKRKSIPNKDQEAPSCQADEETVAGDVTPETPAVVPLSNYDGGKVESKEMDDTSTPAESEVNPEPMEGDPSSETLGTGETRPNMENSENWAADEDLVELIELVEKALSDITEEGDFTESTKVEDPMEPPGHVDDEMISAPRASGAPPQVLESSQVGPPRECLGQVEDVLQADVQSSNEIACCDTLERFGEDREVLEVPKSSATDLPKTDLDADESESFEFIKMSEVNTEEVNSAPIKAENLGTLATPHFISTTDLDSKEIVTCVPTKILEANDIAHPIQIQSPTPALSDDQDIASWNPTKDLDEEIRSPICSEEHELEDLNNTATPIPTEEIAPSSPTKEEMTPTIPALEADTKEITSLIPCMDLNSDKIRPEMPTEERVAPIPPEKSHVEETKALTEETTPLLTEELETGERTTPPEDLETEEVSTSLLIEKLDPEEVRTTVPTEDHKEETKPPTLETVDPSTERIQSQENSLPTEDHKEETKPPTLETVDPSTEMIQSQENSLPTEDPDAKQIKTNVLVEELDAQEATTRVPTEELAKEQMGFSSEEYELEEITPPIRPERLDAEETTPTSTKEPNAERTVPATASIPPEELTTQEIESPIAVEVLQSEEIGTPPSQEHPTEHIPPPPSAKHLETKKMATSLPTEDLNIQEINLSIPTTELNSKNIIPPKPIEELKEIRPSKPSGTEEIPPPALMKALAAQELISAIPLDQEIRPPTETQDTKGITASIIAEELTTVIREEVFNTGENPPQILAPPTCERTEIPPVIIKELDTQELTSPIASEVLHLEERMPSTPTEVEADGEETTPSILTVELDSKMAAPIHTEEPTSPIPTADDLYNQEIWCQTPTEEPDTEEICPLTSEKTESEELPIKKLDIQELTSSDPPDEEVRPPTPTEEEEETKEIAPETSTEQEEELDMKDIVPLTSEKTESRELAAPIPLKDLAIQELMPPFPPDGLHNQETRSTTPPEEITSLNSSLSEKTTTERKAAVLTELDVVTIAFPNKELHHQEISPPIPTKESTPTTPTMELDSPIAPEDVDTSKNTAQIHSLQLDTKKVLPPIPTDVLDTDTIVPTIFSQISDGEESTSVPTEELDLDVITPPIPTEDIDTKEMSPPILTDTKDIPPSIPTKDLAREEMIAPPLILSDKLHDQNERSAKSTEDQDIEEAMPAVELDPKEISAPSATQVEDTPEIPGQELDTQNMVPLIPTDEQDKDTIVLQTDLEKTKPSILREKLDLEETSPAILTRELHTEDLPPVKVIGIEAPNPAKELQNEEMRPPLPIEELLWDEIPSQELDPKELAPEETNLLESEQSAPTDENREFLGGLTDVNPLDNENIAETFQCTDQSEAEAPKVDHQESVSMGEPENKDGLIEQLQLKETDAEEEEAIAKHTEDQRVRETWENSPDAFTDEPTSVVLEARALVDEAGLPLVQDEILSMDTTEMQSSESVRTEENHLVNEPVDSFKDVRIEEMEAVKSEKAETGDEDQVEEDTGILLQIQEKQTPPLGTAGLTAAQELKFQPETIDVRHVESNDDIRGEEPLMEKIQEDQLPLLGSDLGPEEKDQEASRPSECQTELIKEEQEEIQDPSVTIQEISAVHGLAEETMIAQNVPLTEDASVREEKKVGVECEDDKEPDRRPQESETKEMEEKTVPQLPACVQSTKDNPLDANPFDVETVQDSEEPGQSPWTAATEETILAEEKTMENLKEDTVAVTGVQPESDQIAEDQVKTEANTKKAEAAEERSISESIAGERSASVEFTDEAFHLPEMNVELEDEDKDEGLNEKVVQSEALTSDEANRRPEDILAEESVLDEAHKEAEPFPEATLESVNENETVGEIDRTEAILAESPQTEALSSDQAQLLEKPRPQVRTPVLELIEESMTLIPPDGTYVEDIPKAATEIKPQPSQALDGETPEPENTSDNLSGDENQQDGTEEHAALHQEKMSCAHILENVIYDNTNTIFGLPADGIKPEVDPIATETRIDGPEVTAATAELALVTQVITCHFKEIFPSLAGVLEIPSGVQEPLPVSEVRDITETALSDTHSMTDDIAGVAKMAAEVLTAHTPATEDIYSFRVEISSAEKSTGQPLEAGLREDKVVSDVCLERVEASVSTGVAEETWEDQAMFHQEIFSHIYQTQPETLDKVVLEEAKEISLGTDDGAPRPEVETREDYVVVGYESFLDVNQSQEVLKPADEPEQATDDGTVRPLGISSKETSEDLEETSQGGIFETSRKPDGEMLKERLTDEEKDQSQEGFSSSETSIQIDLDEPQSTDAANEDTHTTVAGKTSSPTDTGENICSSEPLDDGKTMRTEVSDQEPQDADPTEVGILAPETEYITLLDTVFRHQELMEQGVQTLVAEEPSSQAPPQNLISEVGIVILDSVDFVTNHEASATSVQAQGTQESPSQRMADENQIPAAIPNDVIAPQDLTELQTQIERENRESTVDEGSTENQKPMTQLEDRDETRENRESIVDEGSTENQKPTEQSEEHEESIADEGSTDNQESVAQEEYMECQEQISLSKEDEETRENQDWIAQREDTETQKQRLGSEDHDRPENQESFAEKESTENWKEIEVSNERDEPRQNPESVAQGESTDLQKQTHLSEGLDPSRENQELVARGESTDLQKQTHLSEGLDPSRENQESVAQGESMDLQKQTHLSEGLDSSRENQESVAQGESTDLQKQTHLSEGLDPSRENRESLSIEEFTGNQKETEVSEGHEEPGETQKESTGNQEEPEKLEKHDLEKENISPLFPRGTSETQKEAKPADSPNPTLTSLEILDSEIPVDIAVLQDSVPQLMETFTAPTSEAERIEAVEQIPLVLEIAATETASPVKEADDEQDVWMDAEEEVQIQEEADTLLAQDSNQDGRLSPAPERPKTPPEPQSDDFAMAPEDPEIGNVASLE
ncbi:uncharacterized protein LOC144089921 [Stigmatopora argus]